MRLLTTVLLLAITGHVLSQDNVSSTYDDPLDFKVGDDISLNEPSNGEYYRSAYYTFEAAKNIRPDLKAYSKEKIYLSRQFYKAPFKVVSISGKEATLGYGIMKNFAILDLELGIRSGEVGNRENMAPIWLVENLDKGDLVQLKVARGNDAFTSAYFTPKFVRKKLNNKTKDRIYVPAVHKGDIFKIANKWDNVALLENDSSREIAFIDLKQAIELDEVEIRPDRFVQKSQIEQFSTPNDALPVQIPDSVLLQVPEDTIPKVTLLDRLGIGLYLAPMVEGSLKESSSFAYGGALGVIIGNFWQVGLHIQKYSGGFSERLIFPNSFGLDYTYTGLFGAYPLKQYGKITLLAETRIGIGEAAWSTEETSEVLQTDNFFVFNPRIGADYRLGRLGTLNLSLGYRMVQGFDLVQLNKSELNSFNLSAMFKIGWFNKFEEEDE